ncbi:probable pre-mRNA-splicing factor ATP-dependent RNA helicase DEAH2 isoform X1 [Actinidia eriantha]|uniref:probable pre-mRNA-splicing factor ATP-dependent RNA helicase DEAH2 isoform X1 n=1 Tax=Actinidia eriantha TaxID=165200 RepID=UPI002587E003|nr:probable pre-mRNA-splicing factor ATP-dependent RNA helicase DEAH2 isoform X1 [Actinidia eriantha]XP_057514355.1 probable pre-mRNA-splicing factor ATP-dependent RNA helicase DEAH2 isoform X1 [Actinidia eriantha]XP_057514356.1 probable pre-mRNA-splicing factor ATP-dependent RNA helicase DEAH2 isoform X1 [Actinidia eriantha]
MGTERKRKLSLFDVVHETFVSAIFDKSNASLLNGITHMNPLLNWWNEWPYSQRYYEILEKRKTLPVWHQKEDFLPVLNAHQTLILVGETGSGKTTQMRTGCVALVLFLNISVQPPDVIKISPCARMEC